MVPDVVGGVFSATLTAVITVTIIVAAILVWGIIVVVRRRNDGTPASKVDLQQREARVLLVHLDDAVRRASDEVEFAVAQFGRDRASTFVDAVATAKAQLREAFQLQQRLDDADPDSLTQRRDWSGRIIHLCRSSQRLIDENVEHFAMLRRREVNAPRALADVDSLLAAIESRRDDARAALSELRDTYAPRAIASVADNLEQADAALASARDAADTARRAVDSPTATAADRVDSARDDAHRAGHLLDAIGGLRDELRRTSGAVTALESATRANLAEARLARDNAPDPAASSAIAAAIEGVDRVLAATTDRNDPVARLDRLRAVGTALDASLAASRNQHDRLEGARTALAGALAQARSQLATADDYINSRRGIGAAARTRLAEAARVLMLAENEADPVTALDLARSSITHSRDADALAKYDLMGQG